MIRKHLPLIAFGISLLTTLGALAQAPKLPTFSAGVTTVYVDVTPRVVSKGSKTLSVPELTKEDFKVLEKGVPQEITYFESKNVPVDLTIMIDVSDSMGPNMPHVKQAAKKLIDSMQPGDRIQLVAFNHNYAPTGFTEDREALKALVDKLEVFGVTLINRALYLLANDLKPYVKEVTRRKAIIILSDGQETVFSEVKEGKNQEERQTQEILEALKRMSAQVTEDQATRAMKELGILVYSIYINQKDQPLDPTHTTDTALHLMKDLAEKTGAVLFNFTEPKDLNDFYQSINQELHSQYTIGYASTTIAPSGDWIPISLEISKPGIQLRHRQGYFVRKKRF
jgi:VWFA-related protein